MKKILVIPNNKDNINNLLNTNIEGLILPIEHLSVNSSCYFNINEIKEILNKTDKEICICINKIMMNKDLKLLEKDLIELNKLNISKILFYDLAVINICKRLNLNKDLAIYQDHLNASTLSNLFYKKRNINYTVITNDITKEEINEIAKNQKLMMICYGYLPIFYSRRYLITNYLKYINKEKKDTNYYIKDKDDKYIIEEEESGTTVYTKEPINLLNKIEELNIDYIILNGNHINNEEFNKVLNKYITKEKNKENYYIGFLEKKTVYKVEDYE